MESKIRETVRKIISENMKINELNIEDEGIVHLKDVEERLRNQEIDVNGKFLSGEEIEAFISDNKNRIIELGRDGYNPFDTVEIIEKEIR